MSNNEYHNFNLSHKLKINNRYNELLILSLWEWLLDGKRSIEYH
jgi:hypothetical protein